MTTGIAQAVPNIAFIKYWESREIFTSSWQPTINKDSTLCGRYSVENLVFNKCTASKINRIDREVCFDGKFIRSWHTFCSDSQYSPSNTSPNYKVNGQIYQNL
jgi:hypothetical protein